jgi:hypothetical protein
MANQGTDREVRKKRGLMELIGYMFITLLIGVIGALIFAIVMDIKNSGRK